jgi:hypothetical protein
MKKILSAKVIKKLKTAKFLGMNLLICVIIAAALLIIVISLLSQRNAKSNSARIMYWDGKVNQHFDIKTKSWATDPDGVSGYDIDKIEYCQKFYPKTASVKQYKIEEINTWQRVGNQGQYSSAKMSYLCLTK